MKKEGIREENFMYHMLFLYDAVPRYLLTMVLFGDCVMVIDGAVDYSDIKRSVQFYNV